MKKAGYPASRISGTTLLYDEKNFIFTQYLLHYGREKNGRGGGLKICPRATGAKFWFHRPPPPPPPVFEPQKVGIRFAKSATRRVSSVYFQEVEFCLPHTPPLSALRRTKF